MSALDDVISTVLRAREDGPDALAAVALSFGAAMELGTLGNAALKARLAATRAALEATEATVTTLRTERDAASAAAKAARQRMEEVREQCDRARDDAEMCARQRDEARARASMLAQDLARVEAERDEAREALAAKDSAPDLDYPARAEVWRLRESVAALRADRARAVAERDRAVQEREAFSLRLSAAERERDEARAERDASDERWATVCRECDVALAERDAVQALHAELVATRADFGHQRNITEDALRERDEARAERDALRDRPTYEARTVAPTVAQWRGHFAAGGSWLVLRSTWSPLVVVDPDTYPGILGTEGATWLPLGPDGLPCAWPVVP